MQYNYFKKIFSEVIIMDKQIVFAEKNKAELLDVESQIIKPNL